MGSVRPFHLHLLFAVVVLLGTRVQADPIVPNLIAYWDFDQTTGTSLPAVVGGYDGTLVGGSWSDANWVASTIGLGQALDFTGGWVSMGELPIDNPLNVSGSLTFAAWVKPDTLGGGSAGRILNHRTGSTSAGGYEVYLRSGGSLAVHGVNGTGSFVYTPAGAVAIGATVPWQHLAVTMSDVYQDGANARTRLTFYVDGVESYTAVVAPPAVIGGSTGPTLLLGASSATGSRSFDGQIDDVGLWSQALTSAHISALHAVVRHKAMGYDLGQTQQLFELHGAAGGTAEVGGRTWTYSTGLSTNPADLGKVVVIDGRHTIALDSSGTGIASQNALVAYWRFDEGSGATALDSSASGLHGTLTGTSGNAPIRIEGKFGGALDFAGAGNRHVEVGSNNVVTQLAGATTMAFWAKLPGSGTGSNGFISIAKDSSNRWYIDDNNRSGRVRMWHVQPGGPSGALFETGAGSLTYGDNTWRHVALSDDGVNTRVFVDGVLQGTYATFDFHGLPNDSILRLGARFASSVESMGGALDDFGIWNTALTQTQVSALHSLGNHAGIRHDLGQVQGLFDLHDASVGGSVRYGSLQWDYTSGLPIGTAAPGVVSKIDGRYVVALDVSGTGVSANAELIAHWRFDEASGAIAFDSIGTNDGILSGAGTSEPTRIAGRFGNALSFDSANAQHVEIGADNVVTGLAGLRRFRSGRG